MDTRESVCLLCPVGCRVAVRATGSAIVGPEFVSKQPGDARVCARGLYCTELVNHNQRVSVPLVRRDGVLRESNWDDAIAEVVAQLKAVTASSGPGAVAIVTGPARSSDEFAAVERLARSIGTNAVSCVFEPQDQALVAAGGSAGASAIEEANCVIVLGDVFFSHPVLSRQIIDAKYTARGNSLFVIDPRRSNTAWFASEYIQNRPGSEALALAALLKGIAEAGKPLPAAVSWLGAFDEKTLLDGCGISKAAVARMARSFADAAKGAIVVAPSVRGVLDVGLVARLARLTAEQAGQGKSYLGLPAEANVGGAWKASVDAGWKPASALVSELVAGRYRALVSLDVDITEAFPSAELGKAVAALQTVVSYSLFRGGIENASSVVLAGASWLETDGTAVLFDGSPVTWKAIDGPSWGVRRLSDVVAMLKKKLGSGAGVEAGKRPSAAAVATPEWTSADLRRRVEAVASACVLKEPGVTTLIALPATGHSGAGGITRRSDWAREMFPTGVIEISARDAADAGVKDGETVVVTSDVSEGRFAARVTDRLRAGVAGLSAHDPAGRALFSWQNVDGAFSTAPGSVRIARESKQ